MSASGAAVEGRGSALLWWKRWRSVVLDASLALVSAAECAVQGMAFADRTGLPTLLVMVLGALAGASLGVRQRWPLALVLLAIALRPAQMGGLLALVSLYTLATTEAPRRVIGVLAAMEGLGTILVTYLVLEQDPDLRAQLTPVWFAPLASVVFGVAMVVPSVLLGLYVRARRRLVESLRDRADGLERELGLLAERAEERAEWARGEERRRIAREMHDVVAHRVSLMVVHAAALQAVTHNDPEKASKNAALIGDMGRRALTELRTMLGVLRAGEAAKEPARLADLAASARVPSPRGPTRGAEEAVGPTLGEVAALVEQSRAAGMAVVLTVEGEPRGYAAQVETTAYRVVQEALTNVHKHAAGASARVRLAHREAEVAVQVYNEPPKDGAALVGGSARLPSGGNGLLGMRERVVALGGGFVSGPVDGGGFRVSAVIPADGRR